ncbi:hypothetical protein [Lacticaseibacillus nasuensis]|uniref:hypothetical protein n=1 Tax=Lacticaseibacillus nasuensis TaxID=944671 RepID=UPI00224555FA|nr:hypothetical protein [Lacticaseibacillus nasuensis]MCX2455909.1 hypothetical protein [Lacticaseibacillus nasuensis]
MEQYEYLRQLAASQETPMRVRIWENKNVIIRRNLANHKGLTTAVWDAWLRQSLRPFGGFEPLIEVDVFGDTPDIRFFSTRALADAVHFILHGAGEEVPA